jgi:hypothetical protein
VGKYLDVSTYVHVCMRMYVMFYICSNHWPVLVDGNLVTTESIPVMYSCIVFYKCTTQVELWGLDDLLWMFGFPDDDNKLLRTTFMRGTDDAYE